MRGDSRHGPPRPGRSAERTAGRPSGTGGGPRRESRPGSRQADARPGGDGRRQPAGRAPRERPAGGGPAEVEALTRLLEPVIKSAGMDLESVRIATAGRRRLLRIVVDADSGVGLDAIAVVSRSVSAELDASGAMGQSAYTLEVSSPGVDRPLTEPRHWRRAQGRLVRVPLAEPAAGEGHSAARSPGETEPAGSVGSVQGRVIAADDDSVTLQIDGEQRAFGYRDLGPGRVQVEFGAVPGSNAGTGHTEAGHTEAGPTGAGPARTGHAGNRGAIPGGPGDEGEPDGH